MIANARRPVWLLTILAVASAALVIPMTAPAATPSHRADITSVAAGQHPNVVLVLLDDLRTDEMRFLPKTERLVAAQGETFTQLIAAHPLCCPARATLTTGEYGQNNGVRDNKGAWGGYHALKRPGDNVGAWLQRAGYRTAYFGKYLNGYRRHDGRPAGWNVWQPLVRGIYSYWHYAFYSGRAYHHRYITRTLQEKVGAAVHRFSAAHRPFFVFVNQTAPHDTAERRFYPPRYQQRYAHAYAGLRSVGRSSPAYDRAGGSSLPSDLRKIRFSPAREDRWERARARALRSADDAIARLVADLRATHQLDHTYLVITSDNGYEMGEHRWVGKNLLFRESLQVPMVIRGPGIAPGSTNDVQLTQADIAAQVVAWAHARPGRPLDGLPFDRVGNRRTVLIQTGDTTADATPGWWYRGVRTTRYTYGLRETGHGGPAGILYDHRTDPYELHNRWDDPRYRRVRRALHGRFVALHACEGADCNPSFAPLPPPSPASRVPRT